MRGWLHCVALGVFVVLSAAAQPADSASSPPVDRRIFGVIPNNRSTEASIPFAPISAGRKMTIAYKDSFDWPVYPTAAAFAALYQLEDQNPSRLRYAATRIFVTRTDSNHTTFNIAEVSGNAAAVALSNVWYPDTRTASDNVEKLGIQLATDAFSNVMKEFWPDVKRWMKKRHEKGAEGQVAAGFTRASRPQ